MIITKDDNLFGRGLDHFIARKDATDELIDKMLVKKFSAATRDKIKKNLYKHLEATRIFADTEQVFTQIDIYFEMLPFVSPEEYRIERQLRHLMDKLKIEDIHRDVFLNALTKNHPEEFCKKDNKHWEKDGNRISKRIQENTKRSQEILESKKTLTDKTWEKLEETSAKNITEDSMNFSRIMKSVLGENIAGKVVSLKEYRENRHLEDINNSPSMLKKIKAEEARISKLKGKIEKKFYIYLATDINNVYVPYRDLAAAYSDKKKELKVRSEDEKKRFESRKHAMRKALRSMGVNQNQHADYINRFSSIMSGILDITPDMTAEERLITERKNLEKFGVRDFSDALTKIGQMGQIANPENAKEVLESKKLYDDGLEALKSYNNKKYEEFAPFILSIPEVFAELLKGKKSFEKYLQGTLDDKLKDFMEGCEKAGKSGNHVQDKTGYYVSAGVRKQYAYMFIRDVFDGRLKGDSKFFSDQLNNFQTKIFNVAPEGSISICAALKKAEKQIDNEGKNAKKKTDEIRLLKLSIMQLLYEKAEDTEGLKMLSNEKEVEAFVKNKFRTLSTQIKENAHRTAIKTHISNELNWEIIEDPKKITNIKENIRNKKKDGVKARLKFLMVNEYVLQEVRQCNTLVRVAQKGENEITIDQSRIDKVRDMVDRYCDDLDLPQILKEALIERGAEGGVFKSFTGTQGSSSLLFSHALAMKRMYNLLRVNEPGDPGMSEEEVQMYIVKCYGNSDLHEKMFDDPDKLNVSDIRKSDDLKTFRTNYRKILEFEKKTSDDPSLAEEIYAISRNLRTMLITGLGVRDEDGKTIDKKDADSLKTSQLIEKAIDNSTIYADYWNKVLTAVRPVFCDIIKTGKEDFSLPEHYIDRQMAMLRQYLMPDVIAEIDAKKDFDAQFWMNKIEMFRDVSDNRKYLDDNADSVSKEEFLKKEQSSIYDTKTDESSLAKLIGANLYVFKGRLNRYNALDEEQKKLFALGLMYLDKSALGIGSEGTMALTASSANKDLDITRIQHEVQKYIEGREYHFEINYREAINKLISYGVTSIGTTEYSMSVEAYEKAMKFVKAISAKKKAFVEKDMERMADPKYSVFAAYTKFNKKQQTKIDAFSKKELTLEDVKNSLLKFALDDKKSSANLLAQAGNTAKKKFYKGPLILFNEASVVEKHIAWNRRIGKIAKRLMKMSSGDVQLLVRILQERTILDKSLIKKGDGSPLHVDELKRIALREALAGDPQTSSEVMEGFDNSESCLRALTSALSFKLRDDFDFTGKDLTRDCFEKSSFNRKTLVDWDLIENAFKFFDEIMEKRASIAASKNSGQLIKFAGNEKANKAYEDLQANYVSKELFKQNEFETTIKDHAHTDNREDIDNALAGYYSLTDQQKVLFFKALGQRDILDISKRDYNKNFFGFADRNYVNQSGRDKLIDDYINALRSDNIGLTLEPDEYYKAMESLYTTQISDRVKLTKVKDLSKIFSYERNFIIGRNTAVDWKLFKRALSFVNRATQELEMTEGNALLYRGAGDIEKTGQINMNYSFLRKNFHRTGNQWARKIVLHGGSIGKQYKDKIDVSGKALKAIVQGSKAGADVLNVVGMEKDGYTISALKSVNNNTKKVQKYKQDVFELEENADIKRYRMIQQTIDKIIKDNQTFDDIFYKISNFIDLTFFESSEKSKAGSGSENTENENIVEKETAKIKNESKKGDIRDNVNSALKTKKKVDKVIKVAPKVSKIVKKITPDKVKDLIEVMDYTVEKATLKFMNEKVFGVNVDPNSADQIKALKEAADKYLEDVFNEKIGKENLKLMKDVYNKYFDYKKKTQLYVQSAMKEIFFIKSTSDNVMNIAKSASNIRLLNQKREESKLFTQDDKAKLDNAKNKGRLNENQYEKANKAANVNSAMADTGASISKAIEGLGIAKSTINIAMNTAKYAGAGLGLGTMAMTKTIQAGLEFVNFAIRVMTDRNAFKDYYVHTEAGKQEVGKIKSGYQAAGNQKLLDKFNKVSDEKTASTDLVDMIADAKGYEHTEELVENTGMAMAQSIIFSASDYNPMAESKLMAITVMSVLKLEHLIGNTSAEAVETLFNAFKMKR